MAEGSANLRNLDFRVWAERDCSPRLIINADREILWQNEAAKRLLQMPSPLYIHGRCLCLTNRRRIQAFDDCLAAVGCEPERIPIEAKDGGTEAIVRAHASDCDGSRILHLTVGFMKATPAIRESGLVAFYQLTRAEAQVFEALCHLDQTSAIAERLAVSVHTVRTHLRAIYQKTSVHSRLQLQRLALIFDGT